MTEIEWTCHVCGKQRPDSRISVFKHVRDFRGIEMIENIRYCNDNPECVEGAKTTHHFPLEEKMDEQPAS